MYSNLKNLLYAKGITIKDFARYLGVCDKTALNKLQGSTDFSYEEIKRVLLLFPEYKMDYIFANAEQSA